MERILKRNYQRTIQTKFRLLCFSGFCKDDLMYFFKNTNTTCMPNQYKLVKAKLCRRVYVELLNAIQLHFFFNF